MMYKGCLNPKCHETFMTDDSHRHFCSRECENEYRRLYGSDSIPGLPIREFYCRDCGRLVTVKDFYDRRMVFCCPACERQYWRHHYLKDGGQKHGRESQGMSSGLSLGNLIYREKRDLL